MLCPLKWIGQRSSCLAWNRSKRNKPRVDIHTLRVFLSDGFKNVVLFSLSISLLAMTIWINAQGNSKGLNRQQTFEGRTLLQLSFMLTSTNLHPHALSL
jgi:hypothetical protein